MVAKVGEGAARRAVCPQVTASLPTAHPLFPGVSRRLTPPTGREMAPAKQRFRAIMAVDDSGQGRAADV